MSSGHYRPVPHEDSMATDIGLKSLRSERSPLRWLYRSLRTLNVAEVLLPGHQERDVRQRPLPVGKIRLVTAAFVVWLSLVFGTYFALSIRQIWPKIVSVLGG